MKFKRKISKQEFEQLTEQQQMLYVADGDNYVINIEDTAFETLKTEKKALQDQLDEFKAKEEEKIRQAEQRAEQRAKEKYETAKSNKDVEAIEQSWQEKYTKLENEKKQVDEKYVAYVKKSLIDNEVSRMSNEISTAPTLISPHIRSRLDVDLTGEQPKLIVLDTNGQRSALTIEELQKSFIDNKDFSAIIKVTSASGGANRSKFTTDSGAKGEVKLNDMTDEQLAQFYGSSSSDN